MDTLLVEKTKGMWTITFSRVEQKNSINKRFLEELQEVFDECEEADDCNIIVLQGQSGYFCTGMDFEEAADSCYEDSGEDIKTRPYMELLRRIRSIPKVIISIVDGRVLAGGVGIVAASDIVISTENSEFGLSEAIWGLMPSMVLPFLIRRTGVQFAYEMTLTTINKSAKEAYKNHLVDCLSDNPKIDLRKYYLRLSKISGRTIGEIKRYFKKLWIITEEIEELAISTTSRLTNDPIVMKNIYNYQKFGTFPWE